MKCENVLVFSSSRSTAESWTAKISDFGNSIVNLDDSTDDGLVKQEVFGTELYEPPELQQFFRQLPATIIKGVDIWCWGMLFWLLMTNGAEYRDANGILIDQSELHRLRDNGQLASMASRSCMNHLNSVDPSRDPLLFQNICALLEAALHYDPLERPSAYNLLTRLREVMHERYAPLMWLLSFPNT